MAAQANNFMQQVLQSPSLVNYKSIRCAFYEREGYCKYAAGCQYAHGDADLRSGNDVVMFNTIATAINYELNDSQKPSKVEEFAAPRYDRKLVEAYRKQQQLCIFK